MKTQITLINSSNCIVDTMKSVVSKSEVVEKATLRDFFNMKDKNDKKKKLGFKEICTKFNLESSYVDEIIKVLDNNENIRIDYFKLKFFSYLMNKIVANEKGTVYVSDLELLDIRAQKTICELILKSSKAKKQDFIVNVLNDCIVKRFQTFVKTGMIKHDKVALVFNSLDLNKEFFETEIITFDKKGQYNSLPSNLLDFDSVEDFIGGINE